MSGSSSWFFVWVPGRRWDRENHSRSRYSVDLNQSRERSCSQGKDAACERSGSTTSIDTPEATVRPPFKFNEERPVLKSLPAIQEDQDPLLDFRSDNSTAVGSNETQSATTTGAVPESASSEGVNNTTEDSSSKPEGSTIPRKKSTYTVTIVPEDEVTSTKASESQPTTPQSEIPTTSTEAPTTTGAVSTETSSNSLNTNSTQEERLPKQESYDSHAKRGTGEQYTPLTPSNPILPDEREHDRSSMSFVEWEPMEDICQKLLQRLQISPVSVQESVDKHQVLFTFCVPYELVETVLLEFQNQGVGMTGESTISVVPSSIHYSTQHQPNIDRRNSEDLKMDRFYSSVKSRLLVAEVIARIKAGAEFSFDFLLLLVLAGAIAFMGLVENSSVVLVASMLVSPLMGPILAGIFGGVIQDSALTWKGIRHETEALFICICIGFILGIFISPFAEDYGCPQWPTAEMLSRGEARSLWVGILIAVPSGAGVALSVLGGNAGSLVGVAISASLLPPAVNAGIFWAISVVIAIAGEDSDAAFHGFGTSVDPLTNRTLSLYPYRYSQSFALESFLLGLISLALTLINILCIILTGVFILRLKEVTPEKIPQKFSNFWRKDIKAHRNYYKTFRKEDNQKLLNELQALGISQKPSEGLEGTFLQSLFDRALHDNDLINIKEWVSLPPSTGPPTRFQPSVRIEKAEDQVELLSPASNTTLSFIDYASPAFMNPVLGSVPVARHTPKDHLQYQPYATYHSAYNTHNNTFNSFLNVPNFFQAELRRSAEFRRRLYTSDSTTRPSNV